MSNLSFFTPLSFKAPNKSLIHKAFEVAEDYFYLQKGNRATLNENGTKIDIVPGEAPSLAETALKLASFCTVVIPTAAFVTKIVLRTQLKYSAYPIKITNPTALLRKKHHMRIALFSHVMRIIKNEKELSRIKRNIKPLEKYLIVPLAKKMVPPLHQGVKRMVQDRLPSDPITMEQAKHYVEKLNGIGSCLATQKAIGIPGLNYLHKCIIVAGRYLFVASRDAKNILEIPEATRQGVDRVCNIAKEEFDAAADRYRAQLKGADGALSSNTLDQGSGFLGNVLSASRRSIRRKTTEKRNRGVRTADVAQVPKSSPKKVFLKKAASRGIQIVGSIGLEVFKNEAIQGISNLETKLRKKGVALAADRVSYFALHQLTKFGLRIAFTYGASCVLHQITPVFLSQSVPFIYKVANLALWTSFLLPTISDLHDEYDKKCNLSPFSGLPTRDQFDGLVRGLIQQIIAKAQEKRDASGFQENFERKTHEKSKYFPSTQTA
ncbi:MAG: hypothetical protein K1000chlam3_01161 [Chlamydiae bacterium]|nr:hypothetical protein [Chlamydiota bacterium]